MDALVRFVASQFLTRLGVRAFLEYALRHTSLPVRMRLQHTAPPPSEHAARIFARLVRDLAVGPTDWVVWCKGDMALTPTATEARCLLWYTFFPPLHDAGEIEPYLAVPAPFLTQVTEQRAATTALADTCVHATDVWTARTGMSLQADFCLSSCADLALVRALYPRAYVLVEAFRSMVYALRTLPLQAQPVAGPAALRDAVEMLDPLVRRFAGPVGSEPSFYARLQAMLREGAEGSLGKLEDQLDALADNLWTQMVRPMYVALREAGAYAWRDVVNRQPWIDMDLRA
jgi:hypothetical protein